MMKKFLIGLYLVPILFISCNQENTEKQQYFPVYAFLTQQLNQLDSIPIAILKFRKENNITDTSIVDKKEFRKIVNGLLLSTLNDAEAMNDYHEEVIEDVQLNDIAITYTIEKESNPIKKIELHISPTTTLLKSLYVERFEKINAVQITRKILWTTGKQMLVASTFYSKDTQPKNITERFNWELPK